MTNNIKSEGLWDRVKTGVHGFKTGAQNIKTAVGSTVTGAKNPPALKNIQDEKVKYRFSTTKTKLNALWRKTGAGKTQPVEFALADLNNNKLNNHILINNEITELINDLSKTLGIPPVSVVKTLKTSYPDIYKYLATVFATRKNVFPATRKVIPESDNSKYPTYKNFFN